MQALWGGGGSVSALTLRPDRCCIPEPDTPKTASAEAPFSSLTLTGRRSRMLSYSRQFWTSAPETCPCGPKFTRDKHFNSGMFWPAWVVDLLLVLPAAKLCDALSTGPGTRSLSASSGSFSVPVVAGASQGGMVRSRSGDIGAGSSSQ